MESRYDDRRSKASIRYALMKKISKDIKSDFPIFKNNNIIYLDNASTTQKPKQVINAMVNYYEYYNANVHRAIYKIAEKSTLEYENARKIISNFINSNSNEIVFTKSTTESINIIANSMNREIKEGDEIIISEMEHHSNIIPWLDLKKNKRIVVNYIPMNEDGTLDLEKLNTIITAKTKLISVTHMSNVIGTINPIEKIIKIARKNNIKVLIDAAQSISHINIDVKKIDCDYLVFSGHKIMGPTGIGVLFCKEKILEKTNPLLYGGHMIKEVTLKDYTYNDVPWKFEAGTPNIAQAIGLGAAIQYLQKFDKDILNLKMKELTKYCIDKLSTIKNLEIYPKNNESIGPVLSFNIKNIHSYDLTKLLDTQNICIRSGHHCAQPLLQKYNLKSLNRISMYYYNTKDEIDTLAKEIKKIINILN